MMYIIYVVYVFYIYIHKENHWLVFSSMEITQKKVNYLVFCCNFTWKLLRLIAVTSLDMKLLIL